MNLYNETKFLMEKYNIKANKNLGQNFLIDEEAIITNLNNGQFISINYTSYCILDLIKKGKTSFEIIQFMKEKYNIDTSIIEKDYNEFVNSMISIGILINE